MLQIVIKRKQFLSALKPSSTAEQKDGLGNIQESFCFLLHAG